MSEDPSVPVGDVDPESEELSDGRETEIREALTSERAIERQQGARTCTLIARENRTAVRPFVDELVTLLEDDSAAVVQQAATALLGVAQEYPTDLTDAVPEILSLSTSEANAIQLLGAQLLAAVVVEHPEAVSPEVHRLFPLLREHTGAFEPSEGANMVDNPDSRQSIVEHEQEEHRMKLQAQGTYANVLVAVAEGAPSALFDHVDELVELIEHDDAGISGMAIDALVEVAEADPEVATPAFDVLVERLNHDDERVYVRAIRALGVLGDGRAADPLCDLAESESDDEIRELAADTADFLERQ